MTQYRLLPNEEAFQVVDGPFAGKKFEKRKLYTEIPPEEARRFSQVVPVEIITEKTKKNKESHTEYTEHTEKK